ncbi:MAG: Hint domain-containing protein [Paracoccaceae bacterium]
MTPAPTPSPQQDGRNAPRTLMRRYAIAWEGEGGEVHEATRLAPATRPFEEAFAALARGTLLSSERGTLAIEDVRPGDRLKIVGGTFHPVLWTGATTIVPRAAGQSQLMGQMIRIPSDALGIGRPMPDLMLGPRAALYDPRRRAFFPAADRIDGESVLAISPPSPVEVFHLGFALRQRIAAHGVEVGTMQPHRPADLGLVGRAAEMYRDLFPHVTDWSSLPRPQGGDRQAATG